MGLGSSLTTSHALWSLLQQHFWCAVSAPSARGRQWNMVGPPAQKARKSPSWQSMMPHGWMRQPSGPFVSSCMCEQPLAGATHLTCGHAKGVGGGVGALWHCMMPHGWTRQPPASRSSLASSVQPGCAFAQTGERHAAAGEEAALALAASARPTSQETREEPAIAERCKSGID
jgi:hypothetical protein